MAKQRRGLIALVTAIVLLALGAGVGVIVGDALGIRTEPAAAMTPADAVVPEVTEAVLPPEITVAGALKTARLNAARMELADAAESAGGTEGTATITLEISDNGLAQAGEPEVESYRLTGTADDLTVEAADEASAARALYDMASTIRAGRSIAEHLGEDVTARLSLRMVDLGAVGVDADPSEWADGTDYSHASKAFADVILPESPYVDQVALEAAYREFDDFVRHSLANGYNAVAFPGFVEFVTFAGAPGGPVYADGDDHVDRALALRDAFTPLWQRADELGMKVFLRTDMLALTTPLADHLTDRFGSLDTENPEFWQTYTAGLDELYEAVPSLDGVLLRIGEAGAVYDVEGWDVYSALEVTTADAVRAMLDAFTAQAEAAEREVIFRTWSVGVGAVGDMHTNVESYEAVLSGIHSPALIVSTKYTLGDFYTWLPLNDTLEQGDQRRIVEFQSRREFENFGAFPNDLGAEYQWALQTLLAANEHIEGVWTWTQDGGPWRAGPMTLYLKAGFWQLYELNTQLAGALALDPEVDVAQVTAAWAREWFSDDPATVQAIVAAMTHSREAIAQGLYIEPFADQRVFALGLEPPPMMWIFEWDILTGDSAVLDVMYQVVRDATGGDIDAAIAGGAEAVAAAEQMREIVQATDAGTWRDQTLRASFLDTLDYQVDVLQLLAAYREMILAQGQWHDTFAPEALERRDAARDAYVALAASHLEKYEGDLDHPAYNLTAAQLGVERGDRDVAMSWLARALLVLALAWVVIGMLAARTRLIRRPGAAAARLTWLASTRPWRARESTLGMYDLDRWLTLIIPAGLLVATRAVQTSLLSWVELVVIVGAWVMFAIVVRLCVRRRSPWPVIAAVGGVVVLRCIVTLFALSFTGPGGYWFVFWTDPVLRTVYITIAFALFVWVFIAAGWAMSEQVGRRRATGFVLTAVGAGLAVPATAIALIGLEQVLTIWNDQMGLLPWGMARILGITTYLEIPADTAWYAAGLGAVLLVAGVLLSLRWRRADAG
ncbi:hypothetical protein [Microbacterium invictum]|nr:MULTISPECIES: hypothetical protein [Microbacterium]